MKQIIKKQKSRAFGKDIYLLGVDSNGTKYWLETPTWDCNWYWGFGYVETYTNNKRPENSKDINSHQHLDSLFSIREEPMMLVGYKGEKYNNWNKEVMERQEIVHNPFDNPYFENTTFTESEGWELGELFKQFYFLKEAAEMFGRGKAHVANTIINTWKKVDLVEDINKNIIPVVTKRILEILTPKL